jgi:diguanylate cyclase (GGDEF)-like protein
VLGQIEDITERRLWREQMFHQAYYDPLTDLPNRRLLLDRVNQALADAHRHRRSTAILFLDLDHFKEINDSLGHDAGDQLLKEVAERLKRCVRRGDTVSRQGGDEFVIVLADMEQPQDASIISRKILEALGVPIRIKDDVLTVTTSIGISVYPSDATGDGYELIKKADEAMYMAKQEGRNRYRYYHETVDVLGE